MAKLKSKHYIILIIVLFSCFNFVSANVYLNEIMLSPTEKRFIELYNDSDSSIDLTGWYLQRKTATGSTFGSLVSKTYFEGIKIGAKDYLLISKTSMAGSDIIVENLTLTESNEIQLKNGNKEIVDSLSWGNIGENKSFQKIGFNNWVLSIPTPGFKNQEKEQDEDVFEEGNVAPNNILSIDIEKSNVPRQITAKIIAPKVVFAGLPFTLDSLITTNKKEVFKVGLFRWNFGDGTFKESRISEKFEHIYFYPGEYVLLLDFSEKVNLESDSSDRITIRVVSSEIIISSVGDYLDSFVEIENKSNYEIVLSDWIIKASSRYFVIPKGTVLMARNKIKFSPWVTGFSSDDLKNINVFDSKGQVVTTFPLANNTSSKNTTGKVFSSKAESLEKEEIKKEETVIDLNYLGASANNKQSSNIPSSYAYFGLGGIIILGAVSILAVRRQKETIDEIEGEIRAEDITIIE